MGALQSIPFCSREKQKEGGGDVPPLQLDSNNNEAVVVADQPAAVAQTPATVRGNRNLKRTQRGIKFFHLTISIKMWQQST